MDYETRRVISEWKSEVEAEMRRLIRSGTPPLEASKQAEHNVSERRRSATNKEADRG